MFKQCKVVIAAILALVLCLSGFTTALAAGPGLDSNGALLGSEASPAQAAISKVLKLPVGTNIPKTDFEFEVKAISVDDEAATVSNMPQIAKVIIPVTGEETAADAGNISTIVIESKDIFQNANFPHAGVYVYEITEVSDTFEGDAAHETMTYSGAKYTVSVFVKDKAATSGTYIYAIGSLVTVADVSGQTAGDKVDPTPGGDGEKYTSSQMIFTNTYVKTNGGDPNDPDPLNYSTLAISKKVTGEFGSTSIYFDYTLELAAPSLVPTTPAAPAYSAYVVENGAVVTTSANGTIAGTDSKGQPYLTFVSGEKTSFSLKHGQELVFINTPVGTSYVVNEAGTIAYTPSYIITYDGTAKAAVPGSMSAALSTGAQLVGEGANKAAYTNDRDTVTPTGLNLNDLPFIGMLLLAVGATAGYLAFKSRKKGSTTVC